MQWLDICNGQLTLGQFFRKMFWRPLGRKKVSYNFQYQLFFYETKSGNYFYEESVIIVSYFELLCNHPKRLQRKNYEIQGVNRFSKFYFTKIKRVGTLPP